MEPQPDQAEPFKRSPVITVAVVVIVLTGLALGWQLALRPRIVPGNLLSGGTVHLRHLAPRDAAKAGQVVRARSFLADLRRALPEHRRLLQKWTARNIRFSIEQTPAGQVLLSYDGPGYAIRQFNWQAFHFEYVGTQHAPSKKLAEYLIARQEQLGEAVARYVTHAAKNMSSPSTAPAPRRSIPQIGAGHHANSQSLIRRR